MQTIQRKRRVYDVSKIAVAQAARGWTDARLASVADVHPATVGRVIKGITQSRSTVKALADALGLDLSQLVILQPHGNPGRPGGNGGGRRLKLHQAAQEAPRLRSGGEPSAKDPALTGGASSQIKNRKSAIPVRSATA